MNHTRSLFFVFILLNLVGILQAELKLPYILSENMVLQRKCPVNIWGWSDAGKEVTVSFAGQKQKTTAKKDGFWKLALKPMEASSEGRSMTVEDGQSTLVVKNILVGEVWHASGQSNMQWTLMGSTCWEEARKYPANDQLRLFKQRRNVQKLASEESYSANWVMDLGEKDRKFFSTVAYTFARHLQETLNVPVGMSLAADGGTKCQYWTPLEAFTTSPKYKDYLDHGIKARDNFDTMKTTYEKEYAEWLAKKKAKQKAGFPPKFYARYPALYYNGNIHPIRHFTFRGALWYQGERNSMTTQDAFLYREYLPLMISSWRKAFANPDLPFYFVQLPKMATHDRRENPITRESQMLTAQKMKNVNMIVGVDKGEAGLHPKTKRFLGLRLAAMALGEQYGHDIEFRFPLYKSSEVKNGSVVIHFDHAEKGLRSRGDGPLREFTICGSDHNFLPAQAKIEGSTVIVSHPDIKEPVAVRYGWSNDPDVNLVGVNDLPAGPFRTDNFELPEKNPTRKYWEQN
ncbi:MAG: hypothetical protein HQL32_12585 [Planctomycetes bacterium]|nr:hypothetical protein [Planctomycetota bacterium]